MSGPSLALVAGRTRVVVDPAAGGRLVSWSVDGHELLLGADPSRSPIHWGCYPMVPWAGRVRDAVLRWDGAEVRLPHPFGEHALHGVGYLSAWSVVDQDVDRVRLRLDLPRSPAGEEGWPFGGVVEQEVTAFEDGVALSMAVTADDRAMPVTVGWHPWFVRHLDGVEAAVRLQAGRMLERDAEGLPTHRWTSPSPEPWDDCFTDLAAVPAVVWPGLCRVEVASDLEHVVVFTEHPEGVCVEPQSGPPDELNHAAPRVVDAGETFACSATLRYSAASKAGLSIA